jgi:DNA excision repair protein ERCC-2
MIQWDDQSRTLTLAVQDLLEGGGGPEAGVAGLAASPLVRARLGQREHRRWQELRSAEDPDFEREVQLRHTVVVRRWTCVVTGRVDGVSREGEHLVVEELKSTMLDAQQLDGLRRDQVQGWCRQLQLYLHILSSRGEQVVGRLVLVSLLDGWRQVIHLPVEAATGLWLQDRLEWLVESREDLLAHRRHRRSAPIPFAHPGLRAGQGDIIQACSKSLGQGRHLMLSAPTGVGKTAAVLQGAIQAAYGADQRIFYATARTTQQRLVLETLEAMAERGLVVRALGLQAKGKSCLAEVMDCHPERCPYAADLERKIRAPGLLDSLLARGVLRPSCVAEQARAASICPYQLALALVERCDVVVGDYNYVFDPSVAMKRLFGERAEGDGAAGWLVLVDEAHNLPERARDWLSPSLDGRRMLRAATELDGLDAPFTPQVELLEELLEAIADAGEGVDAAFPDGSSLIAVDRERLEALRGRAEELALDYAIALQQRWRRGLPLPRVASAGGEGDPFQQSSWDLARFVDRLVAAGEETVALHIPASPGPGTLSLLCRDPSAYLGPALRRLGGTVCLSGTLQPIDVHRVLLGLPGAAVDELVVPSPFPPENLATIVASSVSTRLRHRQRDRERTASLIERVVAAVPGNCALLFPSFAMRDDLMQLLELPERRRLVQTPEMSERARQNLLDRLARPEEQPRVLLGVTGGIFAEGVDLPGDALLAVVVVGPALPAVSPQRELIRAWYQERWTQGFRLAYLVPGMTRVIQAAGRVIRSGSDRGVVVLVGQRFVQNETAAFYPPHWQPQRSSRPWREIAAFFESAHSADGDAVPDSAGPR